MARGPFYFITVSGLVPPYLRQTRAREERPGEPQASGVGPTGHIGSMSPIGTAERRAKMLHEYGIPTGTPPSRPYQAVFVVPSASTVKKKTKSAPAIPGLPSAPQASSPPARLSNAPGIADEHPAAAAAPPATKAKKKRTVKTPTYVTKAESDAKIHLYQRTATVRQLPPDAPPPTGRPHANTSKERFLTDIRCPSPRLGPTCRQLGPRRRGAAVQDRGGEGMQEQAVLCSPHCAALLPLSVPATQG